MGSSELGFGRLCGRTHDVLLLQKGDEPSSSFCEPGRICVERHMTDGVQGASLHYQRKADRGASLLAPPLGTEDRGDAKMLHRSGTACSGGQGNMERGGTFGKLETTSGQHVVE